MDIRRLESAEQNNDEEFGRPTDYEEGANKKNHRQHAKELPHSSWSILKRDLGFRVPVCATYLAQSTIGGVTYSKISKHAGNANILVKSQENLLRPAKIVEILRIEQEIVIFVQYHLDPPSQAQNPFRDFPIFQTNIWDINLSQLSAIRPTQIVSHFAEMRITQGNNELVLAISLSRVSDIVVGCVRLLLKLIMQMIRFRPSTS